MGSCSWSHSDSQAGDWSVAPVTPCHPASWCLRFGQHIKSGLQRQGREGSEAFLLTNCCPPGEAVVLGIHHGGTLSLLFSKGNVMAHTDTSYYLQSCGKHSWDLAPSFSVICKAHKNVWIINLPFKHFFPVIVPKIKISCPGF